MVFRVIFEPQDEDDWEFVTGDLSSRDVVILVNAAWRMAMTRGWNLRIEQVPEPKGPA